MTVTSYLGQGCYYADCPDCGAQAGHQFERGAKARRQAQRWARKHVAANPTHRAHVTVEQTRVYLAYRMIEIDDTTPDE